MAEDLLITLGVQDKGTNKQISAINKELKALDKEFKSASSVSKNFENTQQGLATKLENLNKKYDATNTKLELYKKKVTETKDAIQKKQESLDKMANAEEKDEKAIAKASEQLEKMKQTLRDTERNVAMTENELQKFSNQINETNKALENHAMEQYRQKVEQLGKSLQDSGQKIQNIGNGIQSVGGSMMTMSAPMVAFGGYAVKASKDFEQSMANLQATSGATGKDFEDLTNKAKELGENTCKSATDSSQAMQYLALAGYDVNQILSSTEPVLKASVAWGEDMATSADLATDSMSSLGMSTDQLTHYLDVCSQAQRSSNTTATALMEAYIGCGGTMKALNVPLEESATWLGVLANQGKKGSEAGNALNSILVNLTGGSSSAKGAMDELGVSAWDSQGRFIGLTATLDLLKTSLANCTQEQRTNFESAIGGKTQLDTLNMLLSGCGEQYESLRGKINNATGATEEMYNIMNDTTQGGVEAFKSKLEALGIKIGDELLPHINDLLDKGMELIDWFANLDEGTQKTIVTMGLMTFATGGALTAIGKMATGFGSVVSAGGKFVEFLSKSDKNMKLLSTATEGGTKGISLLSKGMSLLNPVTLAVGAGIGALAVGISAYNTYQDEMSSNILRTSDEMSTWEKCIASLTGVEVKSREELEELGLVYKDFGENIGDDFKKAVEDSTQTLQSFNTELEHMNITDNVFSQDECNEITKRVDDMVNQVLTTIDNKSKEQTSGLTELFKVDDGVLDESEQKVLDYLNRDFEANKNEVTQLKDEIHAIQQQAVDEKRTLNEQEIKDIEDKTARIKQIELEALGGTQEEIAYAKNEFNARIESIDLEGASNLLQEKAKLRDEEIVQIKASYDTQIDMLKEKSEQATGADKEAIDEQIANLEQARQDKIDLQNQTYDEYMQIMDEKNPEILSHIDQTNGEILTEEGEQCAERLEQMRSMYTGMDEITTSGYYSIQNTTTGAMEQCYVTVDDATGRIVGCWSSASGEVGASNENIAQSTKSAGQEVYNSCSKIQADVQMMANGTVTASGQVVSANGQVVGSLQDVTTNADGTKQGILDLNGTPVQVTTNADGVIQQCKDMTSNIEAVPTKHQTIFEFIASGWEAVKNKISELTSGGGVQANAKGTYGNMKGFSFLNEDGWELASNNNITMINDQFGYGSGSGASIRTHMQSVADMKAEVSSQVQKSLSEVQLGNSMFTQAGIQQLAKIANKLDYIVIDNKTYHKDYINEIASLTDMTEYQAHQLDVGFTDLENSNDGYYQAIINQSRDYNNALNSTVETISSNKKYHSINDGSGVVNYSDKEYKEMLKRTLDNNEVASSWGIGEQQFNKDEIQQLKIISDYLGGLVVDDVKLNKDEMALIGSFKDDVKYSDDELQTLFERIEQNGDTRLKDIIDTTKLNITSMDKAVDSMEEAITVKPDWTKDLKIGDNTYTQEQLNMKKINYKDEEGNWQEKWTIEGKDYTKEAIEEMIIQQQNLTEKLDDIVETSKDYNSGYEKSESITNSTDVSNFDYNKLHEVVTDCVNTDFVQALIQGFAQVVIENNTNVNVDVNGIIDKASKITIKQLDKETRTKNKSKGK